MNFDRTFFMMADQTLRSFLTALLSFLGKFFLFIGGLLSIVGMFISVFEFEGYGSPGFSDISLLEVIFFVALIYLTIRYKKSCKQYKVPLKTAISTPFFNYGWLFLFEYVTWVAYLSLRFGNPDLPIIPENGGYSLITLLLGLLPIYMSIHTKSPAAESACKNEHDEQTVSKVQPETKHASTDFQEPELADEK